MAAVVSWQIDAIVLGRLAKLVLADHQLLQVTVVAIATACR